jgi:hypothetical protein
MPRKIMTVLIYHRHELKYFPKKIILLNIIFQHPAALKDSLINVSLPSLLIYASCMTTIHNIIFQHLAALKDSLINANKLLTSHNITKS